VRVRNVVTENGRAIATPLAFTNQMESDIFTASYVGLIRAYGTASHHPVRLTPLPGDSAQIRRSWTITAHRLSIVYSLVVADQPARRKAPGRCART